MSEPKGLALRYASLLRAEKLKPNDSQAAAISILDDLREQLLTTPLVTQSPKRAWFGRRKSGDRQSSATPQGIYLHGPVGRGKSTVMDLFHDSLPTGISRRIHFHAFMLEVHRALVAERGSKADDPLVAVAKRLSAGLRVLCFDEFVVTNIADAMILGRLYEQIRAQGVTWVATSNFPPQRLYEGGLQRDRFLPFIDLVEQTMTVAEVNHGQDYRRSGEGGSLSNRYFSPITTDNRARFADAFTVVAPDSAERLFDLTGGRTISGGQLDLSNGVAQFDFATLFEQPLGVADYLALTGQFKTVFLLGVPQLDRDHRDAARRFMSFVDVAYEAGTELVLLAAAPPDFLYPDGDGAFEFKRTASRLTEMQLAKWASENR